MYPISLRQKQKEERNEALIKTAIFSSQVSSILTSKRFHSWFLKQESRFDWAGAPLFAKQKRDFMFQVRQALPLRDYDDADDIAKLLYVAELSQNLAQWIEDTFTEIKITAKEKKFSIPKGESFSDHLYQLLSRTHHTGLVKDRTGDFYLWNAIGSLIIYVQACDTLVNPIDNEGFEKILAGLGEAYMLTGYPHDILSHDASDIRARKPMQALLIRDEYCSTWIIKPDEEIPKVEKTTVYKFQKTARKAA